MDEVEVIYINSAYGQGAEDYYNCKPVGLELCKKIVERIRQEMQGQINAKHIFLEPTQQIINNCGAVAGLNIASIAAWYEIKSKQAQALESFLEEQEYNILLALKKAELFEAYVRSKFQEISIVKAGDIPKLSSLALNAKTKLTIKSCIMNAAYYEEI